MTTKWHVNVIVPACSETAGHLPPRVGIETGWMPAASLRQAKSMASRVGHALAQSCGATMTRFMWCRITGDRYEACYEAPNASVTAIVARAGTEAGEDERTYAYRTGGDLSP